MGNRSVAILFYSLYSNGVAGAINRALGLLGSCFLGTFGAGAEPRTWTVTAGIVAVQWKVAPNGQPIAGFGTSP